MKNKTSQLIYAYWNDVRNGRMAPQRFDIEPARIGSILPDTFILEYSRDGDYRYRLAGTRICDRFGDDTRGSSFFAGWANGDHVELLRILEDVREKACVQVLTFEATASAGEQVVFELTLLPLVHTRGSIERIMGTINCDQANEILLDQGPFTLKRLISNEVIWPDGRPHAFLNDRERQSPFLPHIRTGRIVRQDRRQFRVYEGGLSSSTDDDR